VCRCVSPPVWDYCWVFLFFWVMLWQTWSYIRFAEFWLLSLHLLLMYSLSLLSLGLWFLVARHVLYVICVCVIATFLCPLFFSFMIHSMNALLPSTGVWTWTQGLELGRQVPPAWLWIFMSELYFIVSVLSLALILLTNPFIELLLSVTVFFQFFLFFS
jgi:hypothetical protein